MNTIYKVNQSRGKSVAQIAEILNTCEMLLNLEIENQMNKVVLHVITDSAAVKYTELNKDGMLSVLFKLRELVRSKEDINELLEEVQLWEE
ncbi:hypothetical protein B7C51_03090 [Paenibacillus larvae subsp. pulvifaciens]|uniref:Uncharacterized protein n=1 Tax=Paenibacillus larvae subsp. pulvifaciens TaxID=1477 RepID=A0A1V0UPE8_9BACL|nr:hypothetical protein [Paenibacillus larvae]ARF67007.1 hypothetical protein B7C51_03090 [Paenibacillus larvae subsp. pulvifaciens]